MGDAVLADRTLKVFVSGPGETGLSMVVRPVTSERPGWRSTRNFVIGFDGTKDLSPEQEKLLILCSEILARFEPHMPADLAGFASMVIRQASPGRTLEKLFPCVTVERSNLPRTDARGATARENVVEVLVRTTSKCNQFCPFCSAPEHDPVPEEVLGACFKAVSDLLPGAMVSLTGGEPTLRSSFMSEVERALAIDGISLVQVQTNAVHFDSRLDPARLKPDPRLTFFVSLHALDEPIYDRCTNTSGQLSMAVGGIRNLLDAGHPVTINTVVSSENLDHLNEMVQRLPLTFPGENRPRLHFSVLICPEWRPAAADYLVKYSDVVPALERVARAAAESGLDVESLLSSTHASMPPCMVAEEHRRRGRHIPEIAPHETGYEDFDKPWVKAGACRNCPEDTRCLGVPRPYAVKFGLDELTPAEGG